MTTKPCPRCQQVKLFSEFPCDATKRLGISSWCKCCRNAEGKAKRAAADPALRQRRSEGAADWRRRNPDRARDSRIRRMARHRESLADSYIKKLLTRHGWPNSSITPELLALKRDQLQARRLAGEVHDVLKDYAPAQQVEEQQPPTAEEIERARLERNARFRARYAANVEKERARIAAYKAAHPEIVAAQRERAKQRKQQQNNATPAGALAGKPQRETA